MSRRRANSVRSFRISYRARLRGPVRNVPEGRRVVLHVLHAGRIGEAYTLPQAAPEGDIGVWTSRIDHQDTRVRVGDPTVP
jgi:hypothetical protein